ncbi:MAG: flagellar assembly protein FliW [Thermovirga sp.]
MTMRIQTDLLGELNVEEKDLLFFPRGLPGFPEFYRWIIAGDDEDTIKWLISVDCSIVALPVASPKLVDPFYDPAFPPEMLDSLGVENPEDAVVLAVLSLPKGNPLKGTANLLAPLVINPKTRMGRQAVLQDERYSILAPLLREEEIARGGAA